MEQKKIRVALIVCVALFAVAFILSEVFSQDSTVSWKHAEGGQVVLSEIVSGNRTYPAPSGAYLDFIEVRNLSANPVELSGYMLSDALGTIGYTFPADTVLPGYGYAVCWCDKQDKSGTYAAFGISREGGETIYLYNDINVLVDQKELPELEPNTALIREDDHTWTVSQKATPGYPNTQEGYSQYLADMGAGEIRVVISEVVTDNSCVITAEQPQPMDYVELTNLGTAPVVLDGAYLSNDPADPLKWKLPSLTLEAGGQTVIPCGGDGFREAPFALSRNGCTVVLTGSLGNTLSTVVCPGLDTDQAWCLSDDGTYAATGWATPGFENSENGYAAWMESLNIARVDVTISEVMASNRSTLLSAAGTLCDWVELQNTGSEPVALGTLFLSDDTEERGKWQLPDTVLDPGQRLVIRCAGDWASQGEAGFALSRAAGTVLLCGAQGNIVSQVEYPTMEGDWTWALQPDGTYQQTDMPTPGFENTQEGYASYLAAKTPAGALAIGEVMASNDSYMIQSDGKYYDWVELVNVSGGTIDLADYCLSNDDDNLDLFRLPSRLLQRGERVVIICSANDNLVGNYIQAPFTLSSEECWVYVSNVQGVLSDCIRVSQVPAGHSAGRGDNGICYFEKPTPGNANGVGVALVSARPQVLTPDGVYENISGVEVRVQGGGALHYTLDGSVPTQEDPVLTGPLTITATAVLRVVNMESGKLPSEVVTASFIINEHHTLPVVSLAVSPEAMFGTDGICTANTFDRELACNLKLFEQSGTFTVDCGVELMGDRAKNADKKSFKVHFRGRYGADVLGYPLYGADGPQVFDALCLNAGSDDGQTLFRDELFSLLCSRMEGSLTGRQAKFCVLYINGQYWGIYSLKEDLGQMYYAQNASVPVDTVTEQREPAQLTAPLYELAQFCREQDMTLEENWNYVSEQLDTDSLIDWMILQGYSCNGNLGENLRYYRSTDGKWQPVLSDLDGAFYEQVGFANVFAKDQPWTYLQLTNGLIRNSNFRTKFLQRLQTLSQTGLKDETVLAAIDELQMLLAPEMERETQRWGRSVPVWQADVERLRDFIRRYDHWGMLEASLRTAIGLTETEAAEYF